MEGKDSGEFIPITGRTDMENLGLIELKIFEHQNVKTSTLSTQMENMVTTLHKVLRVDSR